LRPDNELAILLSPPLIKRKHSEALFFDYPSSSLFPLFRPEEKLGGFLFRNSDSGIENQLYRYNGALDRGDHARGGGVETKGMLKRAYFIALIMNEDALSQMAATTNTGIRYLNCDAVDRRTEAEPRSAGDDRGGGADRGGKENATMGKRDGGSNRGRYLLSNAARRRRRRRRRR